HHLPRLDGEIDVLQYHLIRTGIAEGQLLDLDTPADALAFDGTGILLGFLVQLLENAFSCGDTLLDIGTDLGKLTNRFGQHTSRSDIGDQVTRRGITT